MPYEDRTLSQLLDEAMTGDVDAWNELYRRLFPPLCYCAGCEDLAQAAFIEYAMLKFLSKQELRKPGELFCEAEALELRVGAESYTISMPQPADRTLAAVASAIGNLSVGVAAAVPKRAPYRLILRVSPLVATKLELLHGSINLLKEQREPGDIGHFYTYVRSRRSDAWRQHGQREVCLDGFDRQTAGDPDRRVAVRKALDQLPEDERDVVILKYCDGLSAEEIAASLGLSVSQVNQALHRARRRLREILGDE